MLGLISDVLSSLVSIVGKTLVEGTKKLLEIAGEKFEAIANVIEVVGKVLDIISQNENIDELGAKAIQSEKQPEDFNKISEYIEHLKNNVELDIDKFNNARTEDKLIRKAIGATIIAKGIEAKKDVLIPMEFWKEVTKQEMNGTEIDKVIDIFKSNNMENKFSEYMNGKLEYKDEVKVGKMIIQMYRELEPNMTIEQIEDKIMRMEAKN